MCRTNIPTCGGTRKGFICLFFGKLPRTQTLLSTIFVTMRRGRKSDNILGVLYSGKPNHKKCWLLLLKPDSAEQAEEVWRQVPCTGVLWSWAARYPGRRFPLPEGGSVEVSLSNLASNIMTNNMMGAHSVGAWIEAELLRQAIESHPVVAAAGPGAHQHATLQCSGCTGVYTLQRPESAASVLARAS